MNHFAYLNTRLTRPGGRADPLVGLPSVRVTAQPRPTHPAATPRPAPTGPAVQPGFVPSTVTDMEVIESEETGSPLAVIPVWAWALGGVAVVGGLIWFLRR